MYLKSVEIKNFRPFYGTNFFEFSPEGLNVISGKNGTGKSTLIDAIYWCLYGSEISGEHSLPLCNINIINQVDVGSKVSVNVICTFVEEDTTFKVSREIYFTKNEDLKVIPYLNPNFKVFQMNQFEEFEFIEHGILFIENHFPKYLFPLLFFNDESINQFFEQNSINNVKNILFKFSKVGVLEKINKNIHYLLYQNIKESKIENKEYLKDLEIQKDIEEYLMHIKLKVKKLSQEIYDLRSQKDELKMALMDYSKDTPNIFKRREELLIEIDYLKQKTDKSEKNKTKFLIKQFPIALSLSTIDEEYDVEYLEDMFLKNVNFNNTRFYEAYFNINHLFDELKSIENIKKFQKMISSLHNALNERSIELEELNAICNDIDEPKFKQLQKDLNQLELIIPKSEADLNLLRNKENKLSSELYAIRRKLDSFENSQIQSSMEKKIRFFQSAKEFGELLAQKYVSTLLDEISNILNYIFIDIFEMNNKFRKINIDESFDISLINNFNQNISINDLSFSEKRLLKLALIFSIPHCLELKCPIMLMNPFSNLDIDKRNKLVSFILNNQFNNQILLIMNENQYDESIKYSLFKINAIEYNLKNHNGNSEVVRYD